MALPTEFNEVQDGDEQAQLALANSYFQVSKTSAWKDLMEMLVELVEKAQQEHFSSREVEPLKILEEKLRWQQRLLVKAAIEQRLAGQLTLRADMMEEVKQGETNEYDTNG